MHACTQALALISLKKKNTVSTVQELTTAVGSGPEAGPGQG